MFYNSGEFSSHLDMLIDSLNGIDVLIRDGAIEQIASLNLQTLHLTGSLGVVEIDAFVVVSQVEILRDNGAAIGFKFRTLARYLDARIDRYIVYQDNGFGNSFVLYFEDGKPADLDLGVSYLGQVW